MKKHLYWLLLGCLLSTFRSQGQAFYQGAVLANGGLVLAQTGSTPISLSGEYGITEKIGIGAKAAFNSLGSVSQTFLGGVINWHTPSESNEAIDFYSGATVGKTLLSSPVISTSSDWQVVGQLGLRYYFTEQVGGLAEVGYGILGTPQGSNRFNVMLGATFRF
jgi:hypothetical protein